MSGHAQAGPAAAVALPQVDEVWCKGEPSRRYPGRLHASCEVCCHRARAGSAGHVVPSPAEWQGDGHRQVMSCRLWAPVEHAATVAPPTRYMGVQPVTGAAGCNARYRFLGGCALGALVAALVLVFAAVPAHAAGSACAWPEPGANRYTGSTADAVLRLVDIPSAERALLADMVARRYGWRQVPVTRDRIGDGEYIELRDMNSGVGRICLGPVDRSMWPMSRVERGLVYQVGHYAVIVFSSCGNVARVTDARMPAPALPARDAHAARLAEGGATAPGVGPGLRPPAVWLRMPGSAAAAVRAVPEPAGWALGLLALVAVALATAVRRWGRA